MFFLTGVGVNDVIIKNILKKTIYTILMLPAFLHRKKNRVALKPPQNVLVMHFGLIGDVLMITPLLEEMRRTLPQNAVISVLIPPCSLLALKNNPHINHIITYNAFWADPSDNHSHKVKMNHFFESLNFIRDNKNTKYDLIISSWSMDQPLAPFLVSFLNYSCMIGFNFKYSSMFYDYAYQFNHGEHVTDNVLRMYFEYLGTGQKRTGLRYTYIMNPEYGTPDFTLFSDNIRRPYIIISPFSSESSKELKLDSWLEILRHLNTYFPEYSLIVTGLGKSEVESNYLEKKAGVPVINTVGKLTLDQFAHFCKHSTAIITTESGTMHFASVCDKPVFILLSSIYNYKQFLPYNVTCQYSVVDVPCANCIYGCDTMECMEHDIDIVCKKLTAFLNEVVPRSN